MARIIVNGSIVKYPVGGLVQWILGWLIGLKNLGHDVYFMEKSVWENDCYDISRRLMTNDCSFGIQYISKLFEKYDLENSWCFRDRDLKYYGLNHSKLKKLFQSSDVYLDLEWMDWEEGSDNVPVRVFFDGEPGWFQIKLQNMIEQGIPLIDFDYYYTNGLNIENTGCMIPTAGINWHKTLVPILIDDYFTKPIEKNTDAPFTTVMNWQSHKTVKYNNRIYGQKDVEFEKFMNLPKEIGQHLEIAVSGPNIPKRRLIDNNWLVKNADDITHSIDSYRGFIHQSRGEICIAKNVFVDTQSAWFGDRGGYYMQSGKPVICQDTGFSSHIPCGEGLFAFKNVNEITLAIEEVNSDYERHAKAARDIVYEFFHAEKVLAKMMQNIGV